MHPRIFLPVLAFAGTTTPLFAQEAEVPPAHRQPATHAEAIFSIPEYAVNHRHKAILNNWNSMTISLYDHRGYALIANIEALLEVVRKDIAFLQDSLDACPTCNFKIAYRLMGNGRNNLMMRKYEPTGTFLWKSGNGFKPFRTESDTLQVVYNPDNNANEYQVTFLLNRLSDFDSLLDRKGYLNNIVRIMRAATEPKQSKRRQYAWAYQSRLVMHLQSGRPPGDTSTDAWVVNAARDASPHNFTYRRSIDAQGNIGAGFVRDKISPELELGLVYRPRKTRYQPFANVYGLYASGFFAFARNADGAYAVHDNWFLNVEFGTEGIHEFINNIRISRLTIGGGYLVAQKGGYFKDNTFKAFMNIRLKNGFTLSPELIATDGFRQLFPGLSIKVF